MHATDTIDRRPHEVYPLGDAAACIDFGNAIDRQVNQAVHRLFRSLTEAPPPWVRNIVPAYSSLAVFYDAALIDRIATEDHPFAIVSRWIESVLNAMTHTEETQSRLVHVPVCYEDPFAPDLSELSDRCRLDKESIIALHTGRTYRVYMIGFLPGFPYLGDVDERIAVPRRNEPRLHVAAGSVGIAGCQTGIYPVDSPGGWQVIGRTPLALFDAGNSPPTLFQPGDEISFYSITAHEYHHHQRRTT
ncbi:MAG: hypothetical protein JWP27_26 [Flaviaesturariibacter sp.]|nr:hypothetical protein [Flaviaesturariibacter sp.]